MSRAPELRWETPEAWAPRVLAEPLALLSDHAHCELGAAASAQGLIARAPANARLVDRLAALAAEEMSHFRQVHGVLRALGGELEPVRRNAYAEGLLTGARRHGADGLLDRLLVSALIERRSLERFELLAAAADAPLAGLYATLGPSEAGHARLFVELARELAPAEAVAARLAELARSEAEVARGLPFAVRIHGGPPTGADPADLQRAAGMAERPGRTAQVPCR